MTAAPFAVFAPLLRGSALVVERHDTLGRPCRVGDDEAGARVELARHSILAITCRTFPSSAIMVEARFFGWVSHSGSKRLIWLAQAAASWIARLQPPQAHPRVAEQAFRIVYVLVARCKPTSP